MRWRCGVGLVRFWLLSVCLVCAWLGLAASPVPGASAEELSSSLTIAASPTEAELLRAQEEAQLVSPEAVLAREDSSTAYESLGSAESQALVDRSFANMVQEPDGGPPGLPAGQRIVSFSSPFSAVLDLGEGRHGAFESVAPVAVDDPVSGGLVAVDVGPRQSGSGFEAVMPAAGMRVRLGGRLGEGALLGGVGVTLVPVTEGGVPLEAAGVVDGASVFYGDSEDPSAGVLDLDSLMKIGTYAVSVESVLRSERSPQRLYFRVGLPGGASLVQAGSGVVLVMDAGREIARIGVPVVRDAAGTVVRGVGLSVVLGDVVVVSVPHVPGEYLMPLMVDPTVSEGEAMGRYQMGRNWWFYTNSAKEAFTNYEPKSGARGMEDHDPYGLPYQKEEYGLFGYESQGESRIYEFVSGSYDNNPSNISSTIYIGSAGAGVEGGIQAAGSSNTVCAAPGCAAAIGSSVNWPNGAFYKQFAAAEGGSFEDLLQSATEYIVQEKGPSVRNLGSCGVGWTKTGACNMELNATDPGLGVSEWTLSSPNASGWGKSAKVGFCVGIECPQCIGHECSVVQELPSVSLSGLPEGEDTVKGTVKDPVGLSASSERVVKIDSLAPHGIVLSGLPASKEIGAGEYHLKAEATDGEGSVKSSGVQTLALFIDGRRFAGTGSCPAGPCTAHGEWTILGREYATGQHSITVLAADNAGNSASETFTMIVHAASPLALGPGEVNPQSGEFVLGATDVSVGGLSVSRSYGSEHLAGGSEDPVAAQWGLSVGGAQTLVKQADGSMVLTDANGAQTSFPSDGKGGFLSPKGDANLSLSGTPCRSGQIEYMLRDAAAATKTCFKAPTGESNGVMMMPSISEGPVATDTVTYAYQTSKGGEYLLPEKSGPEQIVSGPDGNLWFTEDEADRVGKISTSGVRSEYALPAGSKPAGIVAGPDGNLWFTERGTSRIAKITTAGALTEYVLPAESYPERIAKGSDGNLWFTEGKHARIGKITTAGGLTEYSLPAESWPQGITSGPDGNLWFTEYGSSKVAKMTTSGSVTEYALVSGSWPWSIAAGPDGNLWFTEPARRRIAKITTSGAITEYVASASEVVEGPDKNIWFAGGERMGKITTSGMLSEYVTPAKGQAMGIAAGPDGNLWYTDKTDSRVDMMHTLGPVIEPTEALAPVPAGVSCSPELKAGCRALTFNYASLTTATGEGSSEWGDVAGHLTRVYYTAYDPAGKALKTVEVAHYLYDKQARLRAEWDPRVSPALKTTYGYDPEGHLTVISAPGGQPWLVHYGTSAKDGTPGRVLAVERPKPATPLGASAVPASTAVPVLSVSEPRAGVRLSASEGSWSNGPLAYAYQWERCSVTMLLSLVLQSKCSPIPGAVDQSYVPLAGDEGYALAVRVTATNAAGSTFASSAVSSVVRAAYVAGAAFGSAGSGNGQFSAPAAAVPDNEGDVWVADTGNNRAQELSVTGAYKLQVGMSKPQGAASNHPQAGVWIADTGDDRVREYSPTGQVVSEVEYNNPSHPLHAPTGVGVDLLGEYEYVADHSEYSSSIITYGLGRYFSFLEVGLSQLNGMAGGERVVWAAHAATNKVEEYKTVSGQGSVGSVGGEGSGAGQLKEPHGVGLDANGYVWVADTGNNRVQQFTSKDAYIQQLSSWEYNPRLRECLQVAVARGELTATQCEESYGAGGTTQAFSKPQDVAFDFKAQMFVTDTGNDRIIELLRVVAPSQEPAAPPPAPGANMVTTVEYEVPVSGTGAPYALGFKEAEAWAQKDVAAEATAIFPPDEPQGWPASAYRKATVYYRDSTNRAVNVALPSGAISTSEYDEHNNVVRSLSADDRLAALKEGTKSAETAKLLDTQSEYDSEGEELLGTLGPRHLIRLANGKEAQARSHTVYHYDEGAPEKGGPYRLVTKTTQGAQIQGEPEQDIRTTATSYAGQNGLGWILRKPTSVTTDPEGLKLARTTVYDPATGNVTETRTPAAGTAKEETQATNVRFKLAFGSLGTGNGQFKGPSDVLLEPASQELFVSDTANNRIERFSTAGTYLSQFGQAGTGEGQFKEPDGLGFMTLSGASLLDVTDSSNDRIDFYIAGNKPFGSVGSLGSGEGQFDRPTGLTVGPHKEERYTTDTLNDRIVYEKGETKKYYGSLGTGEGQFKEPQAVAVDPSGDMWIADTLNNRVQELSSTGAFIRQFGTLGTGNGQLDKPQGIAIDPKGNIWVADTLNNRLQEFSSTGAFIRTAGTTGTGELQFKEPKGITIDTEENLYVADTANNRIEILTIEPSHESQGTGGVHGTQTIYYTTAPNTQHPACGEHPEWANLPCQTQPAEQPNTQGLPNLPVSTDTYNMYGQPLTETSTVTECVKVPAGTGKYTNSTCTVAGNGEYETKTSTRTSTITYDEDGRISSSQVSSSTGKALPAMTDKYSEATGALVEQSTSSEGKMQTLSSTQNTLGQLVSYTDASGNTTKYEYEAEGDARLLHVDDGKGTQAYSYNTTTGTLSEVLDTQGTNQLAFTGSYDVEGNLTSETYPNGMTATYTRNQAGETTAVDYVKTTNCSERCTWFEDFAVPSIHGQWMSQQNTLSAETYTYDQAGRLTQTVEHTGGACTTRIYALDQETNRLSLTTRPPASGGACATEGGSLESHTYDPANRLTDPGTAYEPFGETSRLPASDASGSELQSTFYSDGQLHEQAQSGQSIGYLLDPSDRPLETIDTGTVNSTYISHYTSSGGSPAWTIEPTSGHWTRYVTGVSGLAAIETDTSQSVLQLKDLQGNIAATASASETATKLLSTERTTEYGVPTTSKPAKYSWLGGNMTPTELSSGVVAMGARSYIPQLGRFLQTDPQPGGSANAYTYVHGDPVNETDPTGEKSQPSAWAIALAEGINHEEVAAYEQAQQREAEEKAEERQIECIEDGACVGADPSWVIHTDYLESGLLEVGLASAANIFDLIKVLMAVKNAVAKTVAGALKAIAGAGSTLEKVFNVESKIEKWAREWSHNLGRCTHAILLGFGNGSVQNPTCRSEIFYTIIETWYPSYGEWPVPEFGNPVDVSFCKYGWHWCQLKGG